MTEKAFEKLYRELSGVEVERRLREDFYFFVQAIWYEVGNFKHTPIGDPNDPEEWVDFDVAQWVQGGPKRRGVLAWRQFSKSTVISICYALWKLFRDRNHQVCVISKSGLMAERFLYLARSWIDSVWFLKPLQPRNKWTRDNAKGFDVHGRIKGKDPSFVAKGIDGQITGSRAHTLIADDIEDKENCQTVVQRQKLLEKTNEFNAIIYQAGESNTESEILIVGTFHNEDSVYKELAKQNINFRTWPVVYPSPGEEYIGLSPKVTERLTEGKNKAGDILAPYRVSRTWVNEQFAVGDRWVSLQFKCQANVRETNRYPLKLEDLIVFDSGRLSGPTEIVWGKADHSGTTGIDDIEMAGFNSDRLYRPIKIAPDGEWSKYHLTAVAVDPGGSGESRTAWCSGSTLSGTMFIHDLNSREGGAANIPDIAKFCFENRATTCFLEGNLAGAYDLASNPFAGTLQVELDRLARPKGDQEIPDGWGCKVVLVHSVGQKELRAIGTLETPMTAHRLVVSRRVAGNKRLQYQISHLTSQRGCLSYYDELDSLVILVKNLASTFMIDPTRGRKSALERMIDEELAKRGGGHELRFHSVSR